MLVQLSYWLPLAILLAGSFNFNDRRLVKADADFLSVRTRLKQDHSGKGGDPKDKYFHESVFHPHYDGRFADRQLSYNERSTHLTALMQTYLSTMADIGAETWIMHGTLMGWWWNRKILPWDSDIDVQMTVDTMRFIATYYNMTVHHFRLPDIAEGRDYMLEVNPAYVNGDPKDSLNMIDARWIDTETGLFIDITSIRVNETARALGIEGALMCKDKHHYLEKDLFPLRESVFEGTPVKIPYDYTWLLEEEYKKESLTRTTFEKFITAMPTEETAIADSFIKTPLQRRDYGVGAYQRTTASQGFQPTETAEVMTEYETTLNQHMNCVSFAATAGVLFRSTHIPPLAYIQRRAIALSEDMNAPHAVEGFVRFVASCYRYVNGICADKTAEPMFCTWYALRQGFPR